MGIFGNDLEYSKSLNYNQINRNVINLDLEKIDPEDIIKIIYYQEEISGTDGVGPWLIYKKMRENYIKLSLNQSLNFKNLKKILFGNKLNIKNSYFNIEKKPPSKYPKDEITKLNNLNFNLYNDFNYTIVPY